MSASISDIIRGHHGRDHMVVGSTYAISAYDKGRHNNIIGPPRAKHCTGATTYTTTYKNTNVLAMEYVIPRLTTLTTRVISHNKPLWCKWSIKINIYLLHFYFQQNQYLNSKKKHAVQQRSINRNILFFFSLY